MRSSFALQPQSNGNVLASVVEDCSPALQIFDIRCNSHCKLYFICSSINLIFYFLRLLMIEFQILACIFETDQSYFHSLHSAVFSPAEPSLLAVSGYYQTELIDIRQPNKSLQLYPGSRGSLHFNGSGTRLLTSSRHLDDCIVIYNIPSKENPTGGGTVRFNQDPFPKESDYCTNNPCNRCFAGKDDELVAVVTKNWDQIEIWPVPASDGRQQQCNSTASVGFTRIPRTMP